jgi:hypothetical protein
MFIQVIAVANILRIVPNCSAFRKPNDSIKPAYANSRYHALKIARVLVCSITLPASS